MLAASNINMLIKLTFIFFIITLFSATCISQSSDSIKLEWKFSPKETLKYFIISKPDSFATKQAKSGRRNKSSNSGSMLFTLLENKNKIDIILTDKTIKKNKHWLFPRGDSLSLEVMGKYGDNKGDSLSNITALFFQLPDEKLKVGDTWSLKNVCFFLYKLKDSSFYQEGDTVFKINKITLTDLRREDSESVAIIKYDVEEYLGSHTDFLNNKNSGIRYKYNAIGKFSIENGRWISYNATLLFFLNEKEFGNKTSESILNISLIPAK